MRERYPGYDVMRKRDSLSWNDKTRRVIDERLALPAEPRFFTATEWATLQAIADRIVPQPDTRPPVPIAPLIDRKMADDETDGFRDARLPRMQETWRHGLAALDATAQTRHGRPFIALFATEQDALLGAMQDGTLDGPDWAGPPAALFFSERLVADILAAYYAHPTAWSEIGFGGPASPRGYVRMGFDRRDPWEAVEAKPGQESTARRENRRVR
jgi:hypothetical protein